MDRQQTLKFDIFKSCKTHGESSAADKDAINIWLLYDGALQKDMNQTLF